MPPFEFALTKTNRIRLARAFSASRKVDLSIDCCLEDQMGQAYVDDLFSPQVFQIQIGPFAYFAGDPSSNTAQEMLRNLEPYTFLMPTVPGWLEAARRLYRERAESLDRFSYSAHSLDRDHLQTLLQRSLHSGVKRIDLDLATRAVADPEQYYYLDLSTFDSPQDFVERGVGFYLAIGDNVAGVAYASLVCSRGVEVSLFVQEAYRRRGVATALSANLLSWSLANSLEPHWDAANPESCRLAEKLGYTPAGRYEALFIRG